MNRLNAFKVTLKRNAALSPKIRKRYTAFLFLFLLFSFSEINAQSQDSYAPIILSEGISIFSADESFNTQVGTQTIIAASKEVLVSSTDEKTSMLKIEAVHSKASENPVSSKALVKNEECNPLRNEDERVLKEVVNSFQMLRKGLTPELVTNLPSADVFFTTKELTKVFITGGNTYHSKMAVAFCGFIFERNLQELKKSEFKNYAEDFLGDFASRFNAVRPPLVLA